VSRARAQAEPKSAGVGKPKFDGIFAKMWPSTVWRASAPVPVVGRRSSAEPSACAFDAEELPRREHPQAIDGLAEQIAKVAAVEREQYVGARNRGQAGMALR